MNILLGSFDKRFNSTKNVNHYGWKSGYDTYECKLLTPTSVINPVVLIENTVASINPSKILSYNYAYIEDLRARFYFVTDIVSKNNLWELHLEIDVLGTYEYDISNSTQYVLRSSLYPNAWLYDGVYPTSNYQAIYIDKDYTESVNNYAITGIDINNDVLRRPYQNGLLPSEGSLWYVDRKYFNTTNINDGGFVLGVLGGDGTGVTFYATTKNTLNTILNKIAVLRPSGTSDLSNATAAMLFNGLQYVTSLTWYPSLPTVVDTTTQYVTSFKVGGQTISGLPSNSVYSISANPIEEYLFQIKVPKHPKTNRDSYYYLKHDYLNFNPYRQANLYFQPFGNFPIDVSKLCKYRGDHIMYVDWAIDFTTGSVVLKLLNEDDEIFYTTTSNIGVSVPLSNVSVRDKTGVSLLLGYTALSPVIDKFTTMEKSYDGNEYSHYPEYVRDALKNGKGSSSKTVKETIDLGVDAVSHLLGQVNTIGSVESYISYLQKPYVYCWFIDIVQPSPNTFGYPVNQLRLLNDLRTENCYVKCANANVEYASAILTMEERSRVIELLNGGFYME